MDRRQFLHFAAGAFTVSSLGSALSGCNMTTGGNSAPDNAGIGTYRFPQGLSSGDPGADSGVFWTRVVRVDGVEGDIPVTLEISLTPLRETVGSFRLFQQIQLVAKQANDYIIHHKLTGLEPDTNYYFRFVAGGDANNPVGRLRTLPAESAQVTAVQFALLNGLDWSYNHWQAMTEQALRYSVLTVQTHYMVLLGGAINALVPDPGTIRTVESVHPDLKLPDGLAVTGYGKVASTLADYVYLQQIYRSDERLQKLLANYTLMPVFGEHDFTNDAWQDHETYTAANQQRREQLLAALAAWMRYMPLDWGDVSYDPVAADFSRIKLYRNFRFGNLFDLTLTEQRLQRSDHAIPENVNHGPFALTGGVGSRLMADPAELASYSNGSQKILGDEQMAWLKTQLTKPGVVWRLLVGESPFTYMPIDFTNEPSLAPELRKKSLMSADSWGGYLAQQQELLGFVEQNAVGNLVSLAAGGFFAASEIWSDYSGVRKPVMVECCTAPISGRALSEEMVDHLKAETDPRYTPLKQLFTQSYLIDRRLLEQLNGWVKHLNTGSRGYAMVYVRSNELIIDSIRTTEVSANGQLTGSLVAGRTRATIKTGQIGMVITEFS